MLFTSVTRLLYPDEILQITNGIELRLDLFTTINFDRINYFIKTANKPVMLTLRSLSQGGGFKGSEKERIEFILKLLTLKPDFFDLEYDMEEAFLKKTLEDHPDTKFILSHHEMENKPNDKILTKIYCKMEKYLAFGYKLAVKVSSTCEALELLIFSRSRPNLSVICMGEKGSFARILGPTVGNLINYCSLDENSKVALGQLSISELVNTYQYNNLNTQTDLYGLIGDPVEKSQGHQYHNKVFKEKKMNAVYVKMSVEKQELSYFLELAKEIGFKGLSVTMPLKEEIFSLTTPINSKVKDIQAVNTLLFQKDTILSTNTDGKGAIDAVESKGSIQNKTLVIIGAGGAARAIAFEAKSRGANLWILNRTLEKSKKLSQEIGCNFGSLKDIPFHYDILINCCPDPSDLDLSSINPFTLVMDVVYNPRETHFLQRAQELGAKIIYGDEMFWNQASAQTSFWC